ncbi:MAG TPA: hypothetical protein VJ698_23860 [Noviherbaspirillum sp.]|uniref:hypothetical protein n=1 Tax=Noviherbaspirillum sp. TaxID=1926288 RepID=UPI002B46B596|nr:hypothetical protein [Noviherbaspirillum sp.]HJV88523.1 hypothetical protein [Noviherbaspirillum sp.]
MSLEIKIPEEKGSGWPENAGKPSCSGFPACEERQWADDEKEAGLKFVETLPLFTRFLRWPAHTQREKPVRHLHGAFPENAEQGCRPEVWPI